MSSKLEQVLEYLLAEDNERAEELLHEYVVETARAEYERILDEADDEVDMGDPEEDFIDDMEDDEDEIENDMEGLGEAEEEEDEVEMDMDMDMDDEEDMDMDDEEDMDMDDEEEPAEDDVEDLKSDMADLEADLEDLRAEFEKLMGGEEEPESMEMDMDMDMEEDVVAEATKLSKPVTAPGADAADLDESPFTKVPGGVKRKEGEPVQINDGSDGKRGDVKAKDHTPENNIDVTPKAAKKPNGAY